MGGGALSVVMDGHKLTLMSSAMTLDMISLVGEYLINQCSKGCLVCQSISLIMMSFFGNACIYYLLRVVCNTLA